MAAVGMPIVALVTAAVLLFVFKLMLDAQLTFRQVFAVTCYSFLRGVFSVESSILVMFLTILLLATGLCVAARKLSWGKSLAGVVAPWVVWVGVKVGCRAIFG